MEEADKNKKQPIPANSFQEKFRKKNPVLFIVTFGILVVFALSGVSYLYKSSNKYLPKQLIVSPTPQKPIGISPKPTISSGAIDLKTPGNTNDYQVSGTMTKEITRQDQQALSSLISKRSSSLFFMESYPLQFKIESPDKKTCEEIRKALPGLNSVESFGECRKIGK